MRKVKDKKETEGKNKKVYTTETGLSCRMVKHSTDRIFFIDIHALFPEKLTKVCYANESEKNV